MMVAVSVCGALADGLRPGDSGLSVLFPSEDSECVITKGDKRVALTENPCNEEYLVRTSSNTAGSSQLFTHLGAVVQRFREAVADDDEACERVRVSLTRAVGLRRAHATQMLGEEGGGAEGGQGQAGEHVLRTRGIKTEPVDEDSEMPAPPSTRRTRTQTREATAGGAAASNTRASPRTRTPKTAAEAAARDAEDVKKIKKGRIKAEEEEEDDSRQVQEESTPRPTQPARKRAARSTNKASARESPARTTATAATAAATPMQDDLSDADVSDLVEAPPPTPPPAHAANVVTADQAAADESNVYVVNTLEAISAEFRTLVKSLSDAQQAGDASRASMLGAQLQRRYSALAPVYAALRAACVRGPAPKMLGR